MFTTNVYGVKGRGVSLHILNYTKENWNLNFFEFKLMIRMYIILRVLEHTLRNVKIKRKRLHKPRSKNGPKVDTTVSYSRSSRLFNKLRRYRV